MKRLLILFLLLMPLALAQSSDYNNYETLDMKFNLNSNFQLNDMAKDSKIDFIEANVTIFPHESHNSQVTSLIATSNPTTDDYQKSDDMISFKWDKPTQSNFKINLESTVKSKNVLHAVDSKIKFPVTEVRSQFTSPSNHIDINKDIHDKAREIVKYENDLFMAEFKLAQWIEQNIKYDLSTLTADVVQPSSWVLENREGVCDELTNLFISMSRSLGVPARYVTGVAHTNINNEWGPHAWAEVYFPDVGWVPFDVTYGQFGWVDPSHTKLKTTLDSGDPSIKYLWRGRRIDFSAEEININTELIKTGNKIENLASIQVLPLFDAVGPGSYVPIEVKVANNNKYYLPEKIVVTKAPELTERNVKSVLLEPHTEESVFWIIKIPETLEPYTKYYTTIEVEDMFHQSSQYNLTYSVGREVITKQKAESMIKTQDENFVVQDIPSSPLVQIKNLEYNKNPSYKEQFKIKFLLEQVEPAKDLKVFINNREIVSLDRLENSKNVEIKSQGKDFMNNKFHLRVTYKDESNAPYNLEQDFPILVKELPWYIVIFKAFGLI